MSGTWLLALPITVAWFDGPPRSTNGVRQPHMRAPVDADQRMRLALERRDAERVG